jgi:hypothetical protein
MRIKIRLLTLIVTMAACLSSVYAQVRQDIGTKILIPSSARTASFTSLLVVLNLDNETNLVTITARNNSGTIIGQKNENISVGGRFRSADILGELGAGIGSFGPITVESTNGKILSAISEVSTTFQVNGVTTGAAGFFPGINVATGTWKLGFMPEVLQGSDPDKPTAVTYRTNLGINAAAGVAANVTITLRNDSGAQQGSSTSVTVPANGMMQLNAIITTLLGGTPQGVADYTGYLRISSDQPIIAWASKITNVSNDSSFEIGVAAGPTTPVSAFIPESFDPRNELMFIALALIAPILLLLFQRKKNRALGWMPA